MFPTNPRRSHALVFIALLSCIIASKAYSNIILETATLGDIGQTGGASISLNQFIGAPFSLIETTKITAIGGHFVSSDGNTIFGAIAPVPSAGSVPASPPLVLQDVTIFNAVMSPPFPSGDFRKEVSRFLPAGHYAVIFGSGLFGSSGGGAIPSGSFIPSTGQTFEPGTPIPGTSVFTSDNLNVAGASLGRWNEPVERNLRLVVEGESAVIPIPSSTFLYISGFLLISVVSFHNDKRKPLSKAVR